MTMTLIFFFFPKILVFGRFEIGPASQHQIYLMPFEESTSNQSEAVTLLKQRLSKFETEEGRRKGLSYQPRPNDVAITTTPKAGTTWMQQICHQLRSNGDMNFEEISQVVPWLELAYDQGQDLEAPQFGGDANNTPRIFKTHAWEEHCPSFPKTIVVFRDPNDVLLSFYRFFENWFFEAGAVSLDAFADEFWLARDVPANEMQNASYFVHLISWYKRSQNDDSVLIVFFEDLKQDLEAQVKRVARFLSTDQHNYDTPELIRLATEQSSFEFMKEHESQFDEKLSKLARNEACGLPKDAGMKRTKLVKGKSGAAKAILSQELRDKIQQKWKEIVEPVTGCASYDELRKKLNSSSFP